MLDDFDDCFVWHCDSCGRTATFPPGDFWGSLRELKARGWLIEREPDGWGHTCPRCKKTGAQILATPFVKTERQSR